MPAEPTSKIGAYLLHEQPRVAVLLATYNGAEFLQAQLDSFRAQTYENWELFVSDDGSSDSTLDMLTSFAAKSQQRVSVVTGPREGFWRNFVSLVRNNAIDADLFAYSDQDDVWFANKLARAVSWFRDQHSSAPALYFTRTELIAGNGAPLGLSPLFSRPATFHNALVQNIGGGNTMVFNRETMAALRTTPNDTAIVSHDWWTYQIVTGIGGTAHYDPLPSLQYRQHGRNLVGSNLGLGARLIRLTAFAGGRVARWNSVNITLLTLVSSLLTPESRRVVELFNRARRASWPMRIVLIWRSGVYRQRRLETLGLYVGALLGKV